MCYLRSERYGWGGSFGDDQLVVIFDLNSASSSSTCLFVGTIANKVTLLPTFKASACLSVFLLFLVICSFVDNGGSIHSVIISRRKTWSRRCAISWSMPVLIVGSRVVASRVMPDPSRGLSLSLSLSSVVEGSIFRMK